jgi:hypothetical protein
MSGNGPGMLCRAAAPNIRGISSRPIQSRIGVKGRIRLRPGRRSISGSHPIMPRLG